MNSSTPHLIEFRSFGDVTTGVLTVASLPKEIPFEVRRVFWTWGTPPEVIRGRHAHHQTETVLVAVSGTIVVSTELPGGESEEFVLDNPEHGLYLPPLCWRTMKYTASAVQVAIESTDYSEDDYIWSLDEFRAIGAPSERQSP